MARRGKGLPPAPAPVIFRWDLDKTYLKSEFDSLRELVKIPFEKPEDKIAVPGVIPLIRNLKSFAAQQEREAKVYFISASPPQIAKAIKDKLALDGVDYDGIIFKNQLKHIVRGRFRNLREQVGYKVTELLRARPTFPDSAREVLFGDDWESDPLIYSIYADIVAARLRADDLRTILQTIGVDPELIEEAEVLSNELSHFDAVERIYINLERRTPPSFFRAFGPRLIPTFNYFQTACCLYHDGHLGIEAVYEVGRFLMESSGYTRAHLSNSLADVHRRGHLSDSSEADLRRRLIELDCLPKPGKPARIPWTTRLRLWIARMRQRWAGIPERKPSIAAPIDYLELIAHWRGIATK